MNVDYINPFINASINVFKTFVGIISIPGPPRIDTKITTDGEVNGFIGLNGHGINGYLMINFSVQFLNQLLKKLFNRNTDSTDLELNDVAGELTNMISGSAKAELSKKGFFFDVAVPKISRKKPQIPKNLKNNPIILVPFSTALGDFCIESSIIRIEEDFAKDTRPELPCPEGMLSVANFSKQTGMAEIKVRRFLKTGFLSGKKITNLQWHIPEKELGKFQCNKNNIAKKAESKKISQESLDVTISINKFVKLSNLSSAKIKSFLRSGFLKGYLDESNNWRIKESEILKFKNPKE
ncbi:MAG: hypothetical protein GY710_05700 [Desulfobacteraceae bacterium]|nr:hypothetical protein [Desulfobacteraceae bacterium]